MNKTLLTAVFCSLLLFCFFYLSPQSKAQTPGLIYKIATNGGNKVLDPDGNGYVSKTALGFQLVGGNRLDEGPEYSEIPYRPFPVFMDEPLADLKTGGSYGHTDFAPKVYANGQLVGSPMASYYDGKNFLFRIRLAGQSTASKGYSILIDTNTTLTGTGTNPGFEFEVLLATNFDVRIYDYRTVPTGNQIFSGSVDQYSQKAIAGSTGGGDADYFYDFYVPMSAFAGGITEVTPLRMTGVTVTSAKSGIFGTASDFGGVDDNAYSGTAADIWKEVINNTPSTTPTTIKDLGFTPVTATAPKVNNPIYTNSAAITGSSIEAAGSIVTVFRNGVSLGTTSVGIDGFWSLSTSGITLALNDAITAKVKPSLENESPSSASVTVTNQVQCNTAPPEMSLTNANKGFKGSTTEAGTIDIYRDNSPNAATLIATGTFTTATNWELKFDKSGNSITAGTYYAVFTPSAAGSCASVSSNQICATGGTGNGSTSEPLKPTLSSSTLTSSTLSLSGNGAYPNSVIIIYKNAVEIGRTTTSSVASGGRYTWTYVYTIPANQQVSTGDEFYAKNLLTSPCTTLSAKTTSYFASVNSSAPTITGTYCGETTTVTGTSTEVAGSIIKVYVGATQVGTTTVNANGAWTATITKQSSGTLTATATAPNKSVSAASTGVTINGVPSSTGLIITGTSSGTTIYEGSTSVTGNYNTANGSVITLYINGQAYVDSNGNKIYASVSGSTFTFSNISPFELYAGAKLTVSVKASAGSTCESAQSAEVIVACNPAATTMTAAFTAAKFCPNTPAYIKLSTSEAGVIYNIYKKNADNSYIPFGPSVLGTGSAVTLQSNPVTTVGTIVQVKTIKVGAPCQYTIGGDMTVDLYPEVPKTFTVTATPDNSNCANVPVTITVQAAEAGYSYQLIINNTTKDKIGSPIVPTANGNISFPAQIVSKTTEYGIVITSTSTGCVTENTILKTITISGGPDVNRTVSADKTKVCAGPTSSATISVATQGNTFTYKIYQEGNATALASFNGNNSTIPTTISAPFATAGIKNFYVTVSETNGCSNLVLTQKVSITATDGTGGTVAAGPNATSCGSTYTLAGSNPTPGSGLWTIVSKPATANPAFSNATLYNANVSGLVSGDYTFQWAVTSSCTNATTYSTVTITVNCPAEYSVRSNKPIPDYTDTEVIATVTDVEGIKSAQLMAGKGALPPGVDLNTTNGNLWITDKSKLLNNNYNFVIRITDNANKTTDIPLALRFFTNSLRPVDITPLPVELVYFTATSNKKGVLLQWSTASERDNDRFEIERSQDNKKFEKIGEVAGAGTSSRSIKYSFNDTRPLPEMSYYRLKQVDYDGTHAYSKVISIRNNALSEKAILQAYPNPFSDKLTITITSPVSEQAVLTLYNLQGRKLQSMAIVPEKGINNYELSTQQLSSGVYILKVAGNTTDVTTKVLKK
ncbi:T9SS type A sorting domain-containing protein [Pontibacter fetidus]|uniref:T9SS type A sorting domain-containing protein n=1 Tax=Pontibacter fetidus TaxID=2700082 RepID=A0A6B2GZ82_9BACT|nr:T9SS type A sorting domain-containing protein [Pontibacter fetidus]NDK56299.1 T9SS type A sorting domain-containing protein [Pontibacter fetidus]